MARTSPWWVGIAVALASSCVSRDPAPMMVIDPPLFLPLDDPRPAELVAVLDFRDERPDEERRELALNDSFLDYWFIPPGHYWAFRGDDLDNLPDVRGEGGKVLFVRMTGERAFQWYPYPYPGVGAAQPASVAEGLADYVATALAQRGAARRVVRVRDVDQAVAAGAEVAVSATVKHFANAFIEVHDSEVPRPDDIREYRMHTRVHLDLLARRTDDGTTVWQQTVATRPEEDLDHLFDELSRFRGTHFRSFPRLAARHQSRWAAADMGAHVDRTLEEMTRSFMYSLETALAERHELD